MRRWLAAGLMLLALPALAAKRDREEGERASDRADKVICKRFAETGSLVSTWRRCKTKREWEQARDPMANMRGVGACVPGGGFTC